MSADPVVRRYDRIAPVYDLMEAPLERLRLSGWRRRLCARVSGTRVLEVGVGTGKNLLYYPTGPRYTAIDISPRMLERARRKAASSRLNVRFHEMDVQHLAFDAGSFDMVFATFVFCSVPRPVRGLEELRRVCRPAGRLLLLEHVRPEGPYTGRFFDLLDPLCRRLCGSSINRRTVQNVRAAGWRVVRDEVLATEAVRLIEAVP